MLAGRGRESCSGFARGAVIAFEGKIKINCKAMCNGFSTYKNKQLGVPRC